MERDQPERMTVNGWEYEDDFTGESMADLRPGVGIEYLRPHGGPWVVLANDDGVLTVERVEARRGA